MEFRNILHAVLPLCIPIAILGLAVRVAWKDVAAALKQRRGIVSVCILCFVVQPLVAIAFCKLLSPNRLIEAIVLVAAIAPGDPFVVLEAEHRKGSVPLAIALTTILSVVMPLSLFVWMPMAFRLFGGAVPISDSGAFLDVLKLVVPFILGGVLLRTLLPKVAEAIAGPLKILSMIAYLFVGVVFVILGLRYLIDYSVMTALTILAVTSISLVVGYFCSGFSTERGRRTGALVVALGNYIVVAYIALEAYHLPIERFCAAIAVVIVMRLLAIIVWNAIAKRSTADAAAEAA